LGAGGPSPYLAFGTSWAVQAGPSAGNVNYLASLFRGRQEA
jgi:hypothetical protein